MNAQKSDVFLIVAQIWFATGFVMLALDAAWWEWLITFGMGMFSVVAMWRASKAELKELRQEYERLQRRSTMLQQSWREGRV